MANKTGSLKDLHSVGPAAVKDFSILGITTVDQLKKMTAKILYDELCTATNVRHDPCVIDVFKAAIEQAKDPELEPEKCRWWYWTRVRKQGTK
jgi:hypothetical protein